MLRYILQLFSCAWKCSRLLVLFFCSLLFLQSRLKFICNLLLTLFIVHFFFVISTEGFQLRYAQKEYKREHIDALGEKPFIVSPIDGRPTVSGREAFHSLTHQLLTNSNSQSVLWSKNYRSSANANREYQYLCLLTVFQIVFRFVVVSWGTHCD